MSNAHLFKKRKLFEFTGENPTNLSLAEGLPITVKHQVFPHIEAHNSWVVVPGPKEKLDDFAQTLRKDFLSLSIATSIC